MFNTRFSLPVVIYALVCCIFPFIPDAVYAVLGPSAVRTVENSQALALLGCGIFTFFYMRPDQLQGEKKMFWLWAVAWWILLFGRSTSWGRDYFPEVPKIYFRGISVVLIGTVVFMLLSPILRSAIAQKFKALSLPVWAFLLALASLFISGTIESHKPLAAIWVFDPVNTDLLEELYEYPLLLGLFLMAWPMMKQDKASLSEPQKSPKSAQNQPSDGLHI